MPAKIFSLEISVKVYLFHPVLIAHLFRVRDEIFVQSFVVQRGNVPVLKLIKEPGVGPKFKKSLTNFTLDTAVKVRI